PSATRSLAAPRSCGQSRSSGSITRPSNPSVGRRRTGARSYERDQAHTDPTNTHARADHAAGRRPLSPRPHTTGQRESRRDRGFDPSTFGGHSLRAGFVTSAVKRGANLIKITDVTGHRSLEMLKTYSGDAEAFVGHAGAGLL